MIMTSITITADERLVESLKRIADRKATTLETVAREALTNYVRLHPSRPRRYTFIGIARSGKKNLSTQVAETLEKGANRREGWSLR